MAKKLTQPTTPAISGADEQAAHAVRFLDGLAADYLRDLAARGQNQTAQAILPSAQEATRVLLAFIKAKA